MKETDLKRWLSPEEWEDYQYASDPDVYQDEHSDRARLKLHLESLAELRCKLLIIDAISLNELLRLSPDDYAQHAHREIRKTIEPLIAGFPREIKEADDAE